MEVPVLQARRCVRTMRGRSQARLIEVESGRQYVLKLNNNPRGGPRVLINELLSSIILTELRVLTPEPAIVVTDSLPGLPDGLHFGSQFPSQAPSVWDFFPDAMLYRVRNLDHFRGALVADIWLSACEARQGIFYRSADSAVTIGSFQPGQWVVSMIGNASAFQGPSWTLSDVPRPGWYLRPKGYGGSLSIESFAPWLDALIDFPRHVLTSACDLVPREWADGDELALMRLIEDLYVRRNRVPQLLQAAITHIAATSAKNPTRSPQITPARQSDGRGLLPNTSISM